VPATRAPRSRANYTTVGPQTVETAAYGPITLGAPVVAGSRTPRHPSG
jgi:hypothetical protein